MTDGLTPAQRRLVAKQIKRGRYKSAEGVITNALRMLDSHHEEYEASLKRLRTAVKKGLDDIDAGRFKPMSEVSVESIRALALRRASERRKRSA